MALSTIKTVVAARIAAATSTTPNVELGILKVLGKKLNLNTSNIAAISSTKSDTVTQSTELKDLLLLTQGISDYYGNSYVGELRTFNTGVSDITMDDGSRWLRFGTYETNPTKWDNRYWPYALVTAASTNTGWSQKSGNNVPADREIVVLNSGKKIAFAFNTAAGSVVSFSDPQSAMTTVKATNANYVDYSYDESTDTLWLLHGAGAGLTKITSDGTVVTEITTTAYAGNANISAMSIVAIGGKVFIGLAQLVRRSTDGGASWTSLNTTGLPTTYVVGIGYNPANDTLFVCCQAGGSLAIQSSAVVSTYYSVANANWVAVSDGTTSTYLRGLIRNVFSLGKYVVYNHSVTEWDPDNGYYSYNILRLFNTETTVISNLTTDAYRVSFKSTKIIRIRGTNRVLFYSYSNSTAIHSLALYDFGVSEASLGATLLNNWAIIFPSTDSKATISAYVDNNKLYFFNQAEAGKNLEKLALVGSGSVSGFSHVRIS